MLATTIPNGVSAYSATAYMQNFNFTIEREMGRQMVAEISYAGSRGLHLARKYDVNQQDRTNPKQVVRPYPQFNGAIQYISFSGNSTLNTSPSAPP